MATIILRRHLSKLMKSIATLSRGEFNIKENPFNFKLSVNSNKSVTAIIKSRRDNHRNRLNHMSLGITRFLLKI